jgi:hypothetical protein
MLLVPSRSKSYRAVSTAACKIVGTHHIRVCDRKARGGYRARVARRVGILLLLITALAASAPFLSAYGAPHAYTTQTVEISEAGFNPAVCKMNREYVRFKNVGSTPRRVIRAGVLPTDPPLVDTGPIAPGASSGDILIPYGGTTVFQDADNPAHSVEVVTPVYVHYWDPDCVPAAGFQGSAPPCRTNPYCLRMADVATDP